MELGSSTKNRDSKRSSTISEGVSCSSRGSSVKAIIKARITAMSSKLMEPGSSTKDKDSKRSSSSDSSRGSSVFMRAIIVAMSNGFPRSSSSSSREEVFARLQPTIIETAAADKVEDRSVVADVRRAFVTVVDAATAMAVEPGEAE